MREAALEVRGLEARYAGAEAPCLQAVDFTLRAGDFALLSGRSGCGKSSLIKALSGLLDEEGVRGEIRVAGRALRGLRASARARHIGTVLQNADEQLIFARVEDELAFPLENLCTPPQTTAARVAGAARAVALEPDQETAKLSGGQKQRLTVAATLAMGQRVLLLDEPLANLDRAAALRLLEQLSALCRARGYSVLLVEHRVDLVLPFATRFFSMRKGRLRESGSRAAFEEELAADSGAALTGLRSEAGAGAAVFEARDLRYAAGGREILRGVNCRLEEGGKYLLLGENGCGKSTFLALLAGLLKPSSGRVTSPFPRKKRLAHVGVVLQNPNYQLFMPSVERELAYQAKSPAFLAQLIELFHLEKLLKRHPLSLSEGQKRRLGVACILSMQPDVLFLDEPSVGQDLLNMEMMLRAIEALAARQRLTTLTISHDMRCERYLGDRVLHMAEGRLV